LRCGDGFCSDGETSFICPKDCGQVGSCGDGVCTGDETSWCPADCRARTCGNGTCDPNDLLSCPWECFAGPGIPPDGSAGAPQGG
jgi:hypothetical protein